MLDYTVTKFDFLLNSRGQQICGFAADPLNVLY